MYDVLVSQNSHSRSHAYAVVGAQRRAVGGHPLAVVLNVRLDRVFLEVKHTVAVLLRHHIHVSLQDHARMVLVTRRGGLAYQHVADSVSLCFQTEALAVIDEELRYLFFLARRARDLCEFGEVLPNALWL